MISKFLEPTHLAKTAVKIEFKNDILKQLKFTGTLDDEPIKEVMMYLSAVATFHFVINKEQIVISK